MDYSNILFTLNVFRVFFFLKFFFFNSSAFFCQFLNSCRQLLNFLYIIFNNHNNPFTFAI